MATSRKNTPAKSAKPIYALIPDVGPIHYPYQADMCISSEMYACNLAGNCSAGSCAGASGVCGNTATGGYCAGEASKLER